MLSDTFLKFYYHCLKQTLTLLFFSQPGQKKFISILKTGNVDKITKLLAKGFDPNFQDSQTGGQLLRTQVAPLFMLCLVIVIVIQHYIKSHSVIQIRSRPKSVKSLISKNELLVFPDQRKRKAEELKTQFLRKMVPTREVAIGRTYID